MRAWRCNTFYFWGCAVRRPAEPPSPSVCCCRGPVLGDTPRRRSGRDRAGQFDRDADYGEPLGLAKETTLNSCCRSGARQPCEHGLQQSQLLLRVTPVHVSASMSQFEGTVGLRAHAHAHTRRILSTVPCFIRLSTRTPWSCRVTH